MGKEIVYEPKKGLFLRDLLCLHLRGNALLCYACRSRLLVALTVDEADERGTNLGIFCPQDSAHIAMELEPDDVAFAMTPLAGELRKLPLRAVVAFAARSARRVQHLYNNTDDDPDRRNAVDQAIGCAEQFCKEAKSLSADQLFHAAENAGQVAAFAESHHSALGGDTASAASRAANAASYAEQSYRFMYGSPSEEANAGMALAAAAATGGAALAASRDTAVLMRKDYETLLDLGLGEYPEFGD